MKFGRGDIKTLRLPIAGCLVLACAGIGCYLGADKYLRQEKALAAAVSAQRKDIQSKLARANEEEREIEASLQTYQALEARGVIGEENRLDWVDTVTAIKNELRLFDIRYSFERQKPLDYPGFGAGGSIKFMASRVKLEIQLLHEGDLLNFIGELGKRSKPYVSVRSCDVQRESRGGGTTLAPRLRADCTVDLITISQSKPGGT